jgi:hypothetical protein
VSDRKSAPHLADNASDPVSVTVSDPTLDVTAPPVTSSPLTETTAAPATARAHAAPPPTPAAQITPALLTLAKTADGGQQMTVRLNPAELGMVQIRIERAASGLTQIDITADKPATLLALQRDQPALHRTLDDAGISQAGRTVTFHSTELPSASASSGSGGSGSGNGQHAAGSRPGNGGADAGGPSGGGRGGYPARESNRWSESRPGNLSLGTGAAPASADAHANRIGLDIRA